MIARRAAGYRVGGLVCLLLLLGTIPAYSQQWLTWDASTNQAVAGYAVRCRTATGTYGVPIAVYRATRYYVAEAGIVACQVASHDAAGLLGPFSPEAFSTASPTPTPTPTPTPQPSPTPIPAPCTDVTSGTDALGHVWVISSGWTMRDGNYSMPGGGNLPGAHGDVLRFVNGVVYVHDDRDNLWYRWNEPTLNWVLFGATAPTCTTPTPVPTPMPTVPPPVVTPTNCKISVANKPDATTGWGVQFTRDGVNIGGRDTSAPYERSAAYLAGPHTWQAIWTKSGVPSITTSVTTVGCQ